MRSRRSPPPVAVTTPMTSSPNRSSRSRRPGSTPEGRESDDPNPVGGKTTSAASIAGKDTGKVPTVVDRSRWTVSRPEPQQQVGGEARGGSARRGARWEKTAPSGWRSRRGQGWPGLALFHEAKELTAEFLPVHASATVRVEQGVVGREPGIVLVRSAAEFLEEKRKVAGAGEARKL